MRSAPLLAALALLACRRPTGTVGPSRDAGAPNPAATPVSTYPVGFDAGPICTRDDSTHTPFPVSTLPNTPARVRDELDELNSLCGDTWCEGSFEMYFDGLRCDARTETCDLDVRYYTHLPVQPAANVLGVTKRDPRFLGAVVGQGQHAVCTPPCWGKDAVEPPCETFDVRCTIQLRGIHAGLQDEAWIDRVSACVSAMETAIRAKVPEFAPR